MIFWHCEKKEQQEWRKSESNPTLIDNLIIRNMASSIDVTNRHCSSQQSRQPWHVHSLMLKNLLEPPLLTQLLNYSPISLAFFLSFFLNNVLQLNPKPDKQAYGACAQAKVPSERAIHMCMVNEMYNILSGKTTTKKYMITCISRKKIPPSWTAASGTTPWLRDRFHDSPFLTAKFRQKNIRSSASTLTNRTAL